MSDISLKQSFQDMSFNIELKERGERLPDGCVLESFTLHKEKNSTVKIFLSVGFGYSIGGHNPGVSHDYIVADQYFINHNLSAFAKYISTEYKDVITYKEVYYNTKLQALFNSLTVESKA